MDLALAMGTFGFVVALGVFAFNIVEFRATRRDLARHEERMAKMMTEHGKVLIDIREGMAGMAKVMTEHGKVLSDIRDSLVSKKMGKQRIRKY